jgi:hypothetical protein
MTRQSAQGRAIVPSVAVAPTLPSPPQPVSTDPRYLYVQGKSVEIFVVLAVGGTSPAVKWERFPLTIGGGAALRHPLDLITPELSARWSRQVGESGRLIIPPRRFSHALIFRDVEPKPEHFDEMSGRAPGSRHIYGYGGWAEGFQFRNGDLLQVFEHVDLP